MKVSYSDTRSGLISSIATDRFEIPFASGMGPSLHIVRDGARQKLDLRLHGEKYEADYDGCGFSVEHTVYAEELVITVTASNSSDRPFSPDSLDFSIGIDTYMVDYPEFLDKFFPTMLRCEKTHLYGYFMSPRGNVCAVASTDPVASYTMMYNDMNAEEYGHRIHTAVLNLLHAGPLPAHHPQNLHSLKSGETRVWRIHLIPLDTIDDFPQAISQRCGIPVISAELHTLPKGRRIQFQVHSKEAYRVSIKGPHGQTLPSGEMTEFGLYTVTVVTESGKEAEAKFFCRQSWDWYLKQARREAIAKPQKATTHAESWYGFFSGFLAAKHYPDAEQDRIISAHFEEVLPYMFDLEKKEPLVRPERIQNTACMISVLVDKYEADPGNNGKDLRFASALGDWIMTRQKQDGGYYCGNVLYTSVIYIAKSMLELAQAEKNAEMREESLRHYRSAGAAIRQLAEKLDNIETEGEQTFEDGMISCSVLQLGMYALTLPEKERQPYIVAAQYLDGHHACLEQKYVPDCRVNGGSIHFWEGQYDVVFRANFICSPMAGAHGRPTASITFICLRVGRHICGSFSI